jgi:membrane protease YdiL (CAAX protease family)
MKLEASHTAEHALLPPVETATAMSSDDHLATSLRGFGPLGILAILVILLTGNILLGSVVVPVGAILVLLWVRWSHTPWRAIGYVRPKSWIAGLAIGIAFGIASKFLMKIIVMPLLGADPINQAYHHWAGNKAALPYAVWACLVAGWGEETVFRGYMFERLGKLLGNALWARALIVLLTSVWFGLAHYLVQGLAGTEQAAIVGLALGTIFAFTGQLWMLMCAHAAFDLTALAIIYLNLESRVAHLVFK